MTFGEYIVGPEEHPKQGIGAYVRTRMKIFEVPPLKDGAVIGRYAPVNARILARALQLGGSEPFTRLTMKDDTIATILIRTSLLRKISPARLKEIILKRLKPLMTPREILELRLGIEINLADPL